MTKKRKIPRLPIAPFQQMVESEAHKLQPGEPSIAGEIQQLTKNELQWLVWYSLGLLSTRHPDSLAGHTAAPGLNVSESCFNTSQLALVLTSGNNGEVPDLISLLLRVRELKFRNSQAVNN